MYRKSILSIIGLLFVSAFCAAVENPNVDRSFGLRNAPTHSGQRQRFITGGDSYSRSGNDIVTGNVSGGRHFRGVVPYGSSYYSGLYTSGRNSDSVSDFLRRSTNPIVNDRKPGQRRTYIDPRYNISSMKKNDGTGGLSNQPLTKPGQRTHSYIGPNTELRPTPQHQRPLSTNNMDLEQILTQREQLRKEAEKQTDQTKELSEEKGFFDDALSPDLIKQKQQDKQEQADEETPASEKDVLTEALLENQKTANEQTPELETEQAAEGQDKTQPANRMSPESKLTPKQDIEALRNEGRKVLGEHETFASLADEKFTHFMNAAEAFVKDGQFYKAADTYALAIVWKPEDPRGCLGQSFSLLAAGEYMSSAYYLNRAFKLDPKIATKKYKLAEFVNNRDVFENRILELSTWQERSGSGELAFLLAYISYQDGKATRAVTQIRKAKEVMPNSPAVATLKNIIDPDKGLK